MPRRGIFLFIVCYHRPATLGIDIRERIILVVEFPLAINVVINTISTTFYDSERKIRAGSTQHSKGCQLIGSTIGTCNHRHALLNTPITEIGREVEVGFVPDWVVVVKADLVLVYLTASSLILLVTCNIAVAIADYVETDIAIGICLLQLRCRIFI